MTDTVMDIKSWTPFCVSRVMSDKSCFSRFHILGSVRHFPGYKEWALYIRCNGRKVLRKVGIIDTVILLILNYEHNINLLKDILEHWNPITNICSLSDQEIFLNLCDIKIICRLPILGAWYDGHVCDEKIFFGEVTHGKFCCSSSLKIVFYQHKFLRQHSGTMSITDWMHACSFTNLKFLAITKL